MNTSTDDFDRYIASIDKQREQQEFENESYLEKIPRIATQYVQKGLEGLSEFGHSIQEGGKQLGFKTGNVLRKAFGGEPLPESDLENIQPTIKFPSGEQVREAGEKLTRGYTKPRSKLEEFGGEIVKDFAPIFATGGGSALRSLGIAAAGNIGSEVVKQFGGSEQAQALTKLGAGFLVGAVNPGAARNLSRQTYQARDRLLPANASMNVANLENSLRNIQRRLASGGPSPQKERPLGYVNDLLNTFDQGRSSIRNLTDAKVSINDFRGRIGRNTPEARHFNEIAQAVDSAIAQYGRRNPQFFQLHREADAMHRTIEESLRGSRALQRVVKSPLKSTVGLLFGLHNPLTVGATAGIGFAGTQMWSLLHRIFRDPNLRALYVRTLAGSARNNIPQAVKNLKKLDNAYFKKFPEEDVDFERFLVK